MNKEKKDSFTLKMFRKLYLPTAISSIGFSLADMIDAVVVGSKMGSNGLAAIGISLPLFMVINVLMHSFGIGGSVLFSKLMAEGKEKEARLSFNKVIRVSLIIAVLLALVVNVIPCAVLRILGTVQADGELFNSTLIYVRIIALASPLFFLNYILSYYLRSDGKAKLVTIGTMTGNAFDIVLNVLFVVILDKGTFGAAIATTIGLIVTLFIYLPVLVNKENAVSLSFKSVKANFSILRIFLSGFSTSSQYLYQMIFITVSNNILINTMGNSAVAVFDMIQNASYLIMYQYEAVARSLLPLSGTLYGERNIKALKLARKTAVHTGLIVGGFAAVIVGLFAPYICKIFGLASPDTIELGTYALRIFSASTLFAGICVIIEGYFQSIEEEKYAFVIAILRGAVVLIPVTVIVGFIIPHYFWYLFLITELLSVLFFCIYLKLNKYTDNKSRYDSNKIFSTSISGDISGISDAIAGVEKFIEKFDGDMKTSYAVTMAIEEICSAIINKGFKDKKDGQIQIVLIALDDEEASFELHIRDNADKFNPFSLENKKVSTIEVFDASVVGMSIIKKKSKEFFYRQYQGFNSLIVKI